MSEPTAAVETAKPTPNQPFTLEMAKAQILERHRTAQAAPVAEPEPAAAPAEANPEGEPEQAETVEGEQPETEETQEEQPTEATDAEVVEPEEVQNPIRLKDGSTVTVAELVAGYQRQKDYTQKTMALSEQRKAAEELHRQVEDKARQIETEWAARATEAQRAAQEAAAQRDLYAQHVANIEKAHKANLDRWQGVDWDKLDAEDPIKAGQLWRQYQRDVEAQRAIEAEHQKLAAEQRADAERRQTEAQETAAKAWLESRNALLEHVKAKHATLVDPEKGNSEWAAMAETMKASGLPDEVIMATVGAKFDPRVPLISPPIFDLIRKATLYDQAQKSLTAATTPAAPGKANADNRIRIAKTEAPRVRLPTAEKAALGRAHAQFNKTGTLQDATAFMLARMQSRTA